MRSGIYNINFQQQLSVEKPKEERDEGLSKVIREPLNIQNRAINTYNYLRIKVHTITLSRFH